MMLRSAVMLAWPAGAWMLAVALHERLGVGSRSTHAVRRLVLGEWRDALRAFAREAWREWRGVAALTCVGLAAVAPRHFYNSWTLARHNSDEVDYPLPRLAGWIESGALVRPKVVSRGGLELIR